VLLVGVLTLILSGEGHLERELHGVMAPVTPPLGGGAQAPVLSAVKQSHGSWRDGSAPAGISSQKKPRPAPVGTTFSFNLNVPAAVTLTFAQKSPGVVVKGHGKLAPGDYSVTATATERRGAHGRDR
jgi:hypothetical protein